MDEQRIRDIIREELAQFSFSDRFVSPKTIQILDGRNIIVGKTTGTKIGTEGGASGQKLGFFAKSPVTQPLAITAASAPGGVYNQTEVASISTAVNAVRAALTALGLTA